jgi:hypothetical protein
MKKKHFPRNMKIAMRASAKKRSPRRLLKYMGHNGACRNLRDEFDRLVIETGIMVTDAERQRLWQRVSAAVINNPTASMESTIKTLTIGSHNTHPIGSR